MGWINVFRFRRLRTRRSWSMIGPTRNERSMSVLIAVTGSSEPYILDLPHVLSLPEGFEFRFRYRSEWVSAKLQEELRNEKKSQSLVGSTLLLLFHSQENRYIIPLRRCTILSIEILGPLIFARFRVGPFAKVSESVYLDSSSEKHRSAELDRLAAEVSKLFAGQALDLTKPLPSGCYFFQSENDIDKALWSTRRSDEAWAALATLIMAEPNLKGLPLFQLLGFQKADEKFLPSSELNKAFTVTRKEVRGYELVEHKRYRLRLLEWRNRSFPRYRVHCDTNPESLRIVGRSDLVVGRYDVLEFAVIAGHRGYSELLLRVEPLAHEPTPHETDSEKDDSPNGSIVYTARVPITIRTDWWKLTRKVATTLVGVAIYVGSAAVHRFLANLGEKLYGTAPADFLFVERGIQLIGLALVLVGFGEFLERAIGTHEKLGGITGGTSGRAIN
jgi:hypothetical protein